MTSRYQGRACSFCGADARATEADATALFSTVGCRLWVVRLVSCQTENENLKTIWEPAQQYSGEVYEPALSNNGKKGEEEWEGCKKGVK